MYHDASRPYRFTREDHTEMVELELEMAGYERVGLEGEYLLLACTGDETLDWQEMVARYKNKHVKVIQASDHGITDFHLYLPLLDSFLLGRWQ
jgi:predicted esterase YcpF (UPF0227 family)